MSQFAGDLGSQMMFARSQYEQNAKRKNVIIPKGTIFKNVKIRSNYDNSNGAYYLSTLTVQDQKRGDYDEGQRAFKESDFKVTNLLKEGNNFFNLKNFLVVKNNGFNISENAIVDIELNKDITVSIFDEPYIDPIFNNGGFPANSNVKNTPQPVVKTPNEVAYQPVVNLSPEEKFYQSLGLKYRGGYGATVKAKGRLLVAVILIAGYFAYKKFKK